MSVVSTVEVDQSGRMEKSGDTHNIRIAWISKQSPAHRAAIQVLRRQAKADLIPTARELLEVC
jgi:hypothetical protein